MGVVSESEKGGSVYCGKWRRRRLLRRRYPVHISYVFEVSLALSSKKPAPAVLLPSREVT
jgi:hypothetical protein